MFTVVLEVQPRPSAWDDYLDYATVLRLELLGNDESVDNENTSQAASVRIAGALVHTAG